jgi:hypothetical protein
VVAVKIACKKEITFYFMLVENIHESFVSVGKLMSGKKQVNIFLSGIHSYDCAFVVSAV